MTSDSFKNFLAPHGLLCLEMKVSVTYISWLSDFVLYLEDYLMWWHSDIKVYVGQLPRVRGPAILPYNLKVKVTDLNCCEI